MAIGMLTPEKGQVVFDGRDVTTEPMYKHAEGRSLANQKYQDNAKQELRETPIQSKARSLMLPNRRPVNGVSRVTRTSSPNSSVADGCPYEEICCSISRSRFEAGLASKGAPASPQRLVERMIPPTSR